VVQHSSGSNGNIFPNKMFIRHESQIKSLELNFEQIVEFTQDFRTKKLVIKYKEQDNANCATRI